MEYDPDFDPDAAGIVALRQRALEYEQKAFQQEIEVKRLAKIVASLPAGDLKDELTEALNTQTAEANKQRRKANRARQGVGGDIKPEELRQNKRAFLRSYKQQLQATYRAHEVQAQERERVLALKGANALSDDERVEVEAHLVEDRRNMEIIDSAYLVAKEELISLAPTQAELEAMPAEELEALKRAGIVDIGATKKTKKR